ncbi:MAG: hypothetical protein J5976_06785 [Bacteroidales bacterium]|nr:hypothetical protein [Bacteroidales bacterium]
MKNSLKLLLIGCLIAAGISCEKDENNKPEGEKAARMELTLQKYYNEGGATTLKLWEAGDKAAMINVDAAQPSEITASPITTGSQNSLFTFTLSGAKRGDKLFVYYPLNSGVTYEDGTVSAMIPTRQNGKINPVFIGKGIWSESSYSTHDINMSAYWTVLYASIQKGNYRIKKAVLTGNAGEKIGGKVRIGISDFTVTASEAAISIEFDEALDCSKDSQKFPFMLAPGTLEKGYTITYTTDAGEEFKYVCNDRTVCEMNGKIDSGNADNGKSAQLIACGDNKIYMIDAELAERDGFYNAVLWELDAKDFASVIGKDMLRLDDCKPVDNNTKILATSSRSYAMLVDIETKKLLWYSSNSKNAHSADILPGNRIAVACSDDGDIVQIFDMNASDKVLFTTPLKSAHGVVWNEATQRLYAIGGTSLNIYKLKDWNTVAPSLELEQVINTKDYVTGLHDMTLVDDNTLIVAGRKAALYDIAQSSFTNLSLFNGSTALKAVNYNGDTGECWYVDSTNPEGNFSWSSQTIRYTDNVNGNGTYKTIKVPNLNMYKVRVFNW